MASHWIQKATEKMEKKGTTGTFSRAAKRAGMSTSAFASKEINSPNASSKMKKKALFARNVAG